MAPAHRLRARGVVKDLYGALEGDISRFTFRAAKSHAFPKIASRGGHADLVRPYPIRKRFTRVDAPRAKEVELEVNLGFQ